MLAYNIRIALKSLRRNPWLTALLIGGIAVGICVSTTFTTLRHTLAKDPLPGKSDKVFYVRMDNWDPAQAYPSNSGDPKALPTQISYRDMSELMKSTIPARQTGLYVTRFFVRPDTKTVKPYQETIRMCFADFFPMFNVPFQYGGPWDKRAESKPEPVIVIDDATNKKLFGGANSVGKSVHIDDRDYKVVGVLAPWRPNIRMYDLTQNSVAAPEAIYMPFTFTPVLKPRTAGNSDGWRSLNLPTYEDFLAAGDIDWIQFWVELPTLQQQQQYREFVDNYTRDQRKHGRFQRPLNNKVTNLPVTMGDFQVVPPQVTAMAGMSVLFLAVCALNLVGLLLGKFLARAPEVSVRRALGASRLQVFVQHVVEVEVVGLIGGILGILLSVATLLIVRKFMPANLPVQLDTEMVAVSSLLSLVAGFLAGVYPAWRICTLPPAMQLKLQ